MYIARFSTLLLAGILSAPALYRAYVVGDLDRSTALMRCLIAIAISAAMLWVLRSLAAGFQRATAEAKIKAEAEAAVERRRKADEEAMTGTVE